MPAWVPFAATGGLAGVLTAVVIILIIEFWP